MLCEVYVEGGLLVAPLLAAQYDQTPTQRGGCVAELRRGQVVQQHGPQHLRTEETPCETLQVKPDFLTSVVLQNPFISRDIQASGRRTPHHHLHILICK